jgi:phosphonopyruvate decarboxylase
MISPEALFEALKRRGIGLFAGVPDSVLSSFCAYVNDHSLASGHIITANEGNAVALAAGYHLSTGRTAAVYMQNSGLGNALNPLASLLDSEVYCIPLLMIIGWRGEPSIADEPQHVKQGRITRAQLELLDIPFWILDADSDFEKILNAAFDALHKINAPVALLVRKNTFFNYTSQHNIPCESSMVREQALDRIMGLIDDADLVVATTGKTSREVFDLRQRHNQEQRDFLTVGSMGHASSIALGVALGNPSRRVICLDGDGAALMHLGAVPIIGAIGPRNLVHVLLNNAAHESVGGQPTVAGEIDFKSIVKACGYRVYAFADNLEALTTGWTKLQDEDGPVLLEVRIQIGSRDNLGRPTISPEETKRSFMRAAID